MKKLFMLLAGLFLITASYAHQFYGYPYIQKIKNFTLTDHNGKRVSLSDFRGKVSSYIFRLYLLP
ncbi:MAG: hypothetical protein Q9M89_07155 [Persephonella sp.]|nr:hypothetical protein [Persephonella sp.]